MMNIRKRILTWLLKDDAAIEAVTELQIGSDGSEGRSFTWQRGGSDVNSEKRFRELTPEIVEEMSQAELSDELIETDPTISRIYNDFVTFATLGFELTCEDPRGQEILDAFRVLLRERRNSMNSVLSKLFGSILAHGSYCLEITFDRFRSPTNLFVINPTTLYFRSRGDGDGSTIWDLGQYDDEDRFKVLSPDRVFYDATNPLVDKFKGHSMVAPAFPSVLGAKFMLRDLQDVIHNHAWVRKFIRINDLELRDKGLKPETIKKRVSDIETMIKANNNFKDPSLVPVFSGPVEFGQLEGVQSGGMTFVDSTSRVLDRQAIRGASGSPTHLGSNEFTAESSAQSQGLRASVWMESFQELIEDVVGLALSMALQGAGITEPAVLSLRRVDVVERELEADIFTKVASGVLNLQRAGMKVLDAIELYQVTTNTFIPEAFKEQLRRGVADAEPERDEETD